MIFIKLLQQIFGILTLCFTIKCTWILDNGKIIMIFEADDINLRNIHQRTDNIEIAPVKMRNRRKCIKSSFKHKRKQHRFYHVIFMMSISNLVAAKLNYRLIQCSFTKLCAKRAGAVLFVLLFYNCPNLCWNNMICHIQLLTQCFNFC